DEPPFEPTNEAEPKELEAEATIEPEISEPEESSAVDEPTEEQPAEPKTNTAGNTRAQEHRRHSSDGHVHGDTQQRKGGKRIGRWIYANLEQPNHLRVDKSVYPDGDRRFYQFHWSGAQWIFGVKGTYAERKIPYLLPALKAALQADPDVEVQIGEG